MNFANLKNLIKQFANDTWKLHVKRRLDIYRDDWDNVIQAEINRQFSARAIQRLRLLKTKEFNLIKRVANELGIIYKNPAQRVAYTSETTKDDAGAEKVVISPDENYQAMLETFGMDSIMKEVDRHVIFLNQVLLRPVVREGKMDVDLMTFDNVEVFTDPDDWKKIVAVKLYFGLSIPELTYDRDSAMGKWRGGMQTGNGNRISKYSQAILYTLEEFTENIYDEAQGKDMPQERKRGMIYYYDAPGVDASPTREESLPPEYVGENGDPMLPFVLFWKKFPTNCLIDHTSGGDLEDATVGLALNLVHLNALSKFQAHKIIALTTKDISKVAAQVNVGIGELVKIQDSEGTSKLEVLDNESDVGGFWKYVQERVTLFLSNFGISPMNFTLSGTPQSGYALKISNQAKMEQREDRLDIYREREFELFRVMRMVWNHAMPTKKINTNAKFKIDFGEINYPDSPDEEQRSATWKISQNIKTPVDYIMAENPDLTPAEAEQKYLENKRLNSRLTATVKPPAQPGAGSNSSQNTTPSR